MSSSSDKATSTAGSSAASAVSTSTASVAGTSTANTTGTSRTNNPIAQILQGLHFMQNEIMSVRRGQEEAARATRRKEEELQSVCHAQEETARMVQASQMESAWSSYKGKKPAYTFKKKGTRSLRCSSTRWWTRWHRRRVVLRGSK